MKAVAVFPGKREVKLVNHEAPALTGAADVKLRMLEVGVCGTDKEICAFQYGAPPSGTAYLVIGHESLGEVIEVGADVSRVRVGDLVVPSVRRPCPHERCQACRADRQDFCYTGDFTERGLKEAHGFMAEFVVDHERYMNPVPAELREIGVLVEPLTIAEKALIQVWDIQERLPWSCSVEPGKGRAHGRRGLVLGAGPVGLLGAMTLVQSGFDTYVYSHGSGPKASIVESIGATFVSAEAKAAEMLPDLIGEIDLVYEAVGASRLAFQVLKIIGPNAVFIFTGVPGRKAPIEVDADRIMRNLVLNNQVVFGTVNAGPPAFEAAIRDLGVFAQRWPEVVRSLITGRHPIEAHAEFLLGRSEGIKNVISL